MEISFWGKELLNLQTLLPVLPVGLCEGKADTGWTLWRSEGLDEVLLGGSWIVVHGTL